MMGWDEVISCTRINRSYIRKTHSAHVSMNSCTEKRHHNMTLTVVRTQATGKWLVTRERLSLLAQSQGL